MIGAGLVRGFVGQINTIAAAVLATLAGTTGAGMVGTADGGTVQGALTAHAGQLATQAGQLTAITGEAISIRSYAKGDGTPEGAAFAEALASAVATGRSIQFPPGTYNFSDLATPTVTGVVDLVGDGFERVTVIGAAGLSLVTLNGGSTFRARGIKFDTWRDVAHLASNAGGAAFELLDVERCWFTNVEVSPISDRATPADGGINVLRFSRNLCTAMGRVNALNSAGLRLDSAAIYSGFVTENEIRGVGGAGYTGQKDGISLGAVTVTPLSSLYVAGNRIYDVENGGTEHISGITVFGRHTRVVDNAVNTVKSANAGNIDQYGIYTKASYSTIRGNTLADAGGNAACIMTKGYPNDLNGAALNANDDDNIIADNTILIVSRWASVAAYVGITTYNAGMNVHDNLIEGTTTGVVAIKQVVAGGNVGRDSIHHNKVRNLVGTATQRCVAIQVNDANQSAVEFNELLSIGSGIEPAAYGVLMENNSGGTFSGFTCRGNTVDTCSAASANNARAIFLSFDVNGGMSDVMVEDNNVKNAGHGIRPAFAGVVSKVHFRRNRIDTMSLSHFDYSGVPPNDGVMEGNTVDGADYIAIPSGTANPLFDGVDNLKITNTGPTTISVFTRPIGNQLLRLEILDAGNTTIANNGSIKLAGGVNWTPVNGGMLTLRRSGGQFREVCRTAY